PHRVSQKFVEGILRKHAESVATVRFGQQLVSFEERPDHVRAVIEDVSTGEQKLVEADYLIGADGARSTVRRQLGFRFEGETGVTRDFFGGKMVAVYLRAPDFSKVVPHDKAWMYCSFNTQRRSWLASVNGRDEFAFHTQLKPGESEDVTEDR